MQKLKAMEVHGAKVLTTRQIAYCYGTEVKVIHNNFNRNRDRYILEKHYISIEGDELKKLKTYPQFEGELNRASKAYFWTEKGALLHAKSLNTDKAWEVYDYLVDFYFRAKEKPIKQKKLELKVPEDKRISETRIPDMKNPINIFRTLLQLAHDKGIEVNSYDFEKVYSALYNRKIGIRTQLLLEQVNYELAYELSHALIHNDCGNLIESPIRKEYDTQAERAAEMIISLLNIQVA